MLRKALFSLIPLALSAASFACSDDATSPAATEKDDPGAGSEPADAGVVDDSPRPVADGGAGGDSSAEPDSGAPAGGRIIAYAYSANTASPESTPSAAYAYNASDGAIEIARASVGVYHVTFAGLSLENSVALVSAYASPGGECHWTSTAEATVSVRCLDAGGSNADSRFVVTVFDKSSTTGASVLGFAHANDKQSDSYTPQAKRSNNAVGGGAITASRTATGTYAMDFAGLGPTDIENVQVMPYGSETARCVIQSWIGTNVNVRCYESGVLTDAEYVVMIAGERAGATAKVVAYAHAADEANASYSPTLAYNEGGGSVAASRSAAGTYSIAFTGRDLDEGAHVQVTAQGKGRRCNVGSWAEAIVNLTCTNVGGTKADNNYGIVVLQ